MTYMNMEYEVRQIFCVMFCALLNYFTLIVLKKKEPQPVHAT